MNDQTQRTTDSKLLEEIIIKHDLDGNSAMVEFTEDGHYGINLPKHLSGDDVTDETPIPDNVKLATGLIILLEATNLAEIADMIIDKAYDYEKPSELVLPPLTWKFTN